MSWYQVCRWLSWESARFVLQPRVEGLEHIPREGPFILAANHVSALDPILVQGPCPRPVHAMTKSTQFSHPFFQWLLPRILAFPTRRYRVDPQAVRIVLRLLEAGEPVGIYPEGERSWDGGLQPFRRGAMRLLLKADVPVVPCGISGAFEVFPRWSRKLQRHPVTIRYGPPLHFGPHPDRASREAALESATRRFHEAMEALVAPGEGDPVPCVEELQRLRGRLATGQAPT